MELVIKPFHINTYPLKGLFVKSPLVSAWIYEIQRLEFSLNEIQIFPIPNTTANSIWGCLIIFKSNIEKFKIGKNELCQMVTKNVFIPEKAILHPIVEITEIEKLFQGNKHVFHPDFGLVELTEELNLQDLIIPPTLKSYFITQPEESVYLPSEIKSFQVIPIPPEEMLKKMEEEVFPKTKKMNTKPLSSFDKGKLAFYRSLFNNKKTGDGSFQIEKTGFMSKLESLFSALTKKENKWSERLEEDFKDLEERNQKQIDRLLNLLKNNPEEALKYAIPIDNTGSMRGKSGGSLTLSQQWSNFSIFGNHVSNGSGRTVDLGDHTRRLEAQYEDTAQQLIQQKEFQKAAFVYLKLLKNNQKAAETLVLGGFYQEAAMIYLKYMMNKSKAAECYVEGNMITEAIKIYKELNLNEKVGDLYMDLHKEEEATVYYHKVIEEYVNHNQYVKASFIYKNKLKNESGGQSLLLQGWKQNKDAFNCLNNYFENIKDLKLLKIEMDTIYKNDVNETNREDF